MNRFFENKCDDIEIEAIIMYFSEHPEEIDRYLTKEEWNKIPADGSLDPLVSERMKKTLYAKIFPNLKPQKVPLYRRYSIPAVAASLILIVALSWLIQRNIQNQDPLQAAQRILPSNPQAARYSDTSVWLTRVNHTSKKEKILLLDGSVVILSQNSSIRYPLHFKKNKRSIYLTGEAFFEVAKDRTRPFTVYSDVLSTTALGTSFRIKITDAKKKRISVQLYTGKVMIRSTEKLSNWSGDVFLLPGQEMAYEGEEYPVKVTSLNMTQSIRNTPEGVHGKVAMEKKELNFNNSSLSEVLTELSLIFNVSIRFTDKELNKMNFTGTINRSDNIQDVLKLIAQMNGLELKESADGFTITKIN